MKTDIYSMHFDRLLYILTNCKTGLTMITTQKKAIKDLIDLANYNPKWSNEAKTEIAHIKSALGNNLITDIQHIGSTAIPDIKSKPIIDIIIGVTSFDNIKKNSLNR